MKRETAVALHAEAAQPELRLAGGSSGVDKRLSPAKHRAFDLNQDHKSEMNERGTRAA
jgi:hypothetical protein